MDKFANFLNQIPSDICQKVENYLFNEIAVLKPQNFIAGTTMHSIDFHIIVPNECLPDTYINGKLQSFQNGKIVAINPGESILCTKGNTTKKYISLLLKPEIINRVAQEMDFSGDVRFLNLQNPFSCELIHAINSFVKEAERPDCFQLMLDCLSIQIVALLLRKFSSNMKMYPVDSPNYDPYIEHAIEYIETFFNADLTVTDICNEINVSPFHFIRTFKQKVGVSPHKYLMNVRIRKAEELLCLRQHTIAEVAMLCGFLSQSHFSSAFKDMKHQSPSEYKKLKSYSIF